MAPGRILHVLVVDDDDPIRALIADIFRSEGYVVTQAINGMEALGEVARERPDAVVLDMMMPVMDGPRFARACHALSPRHPVPILLVSASLRSWQMAEQLRRFGVRGFVAKPFDVGHLVDAVERIAEPAELLAAV